MNLNESLSETLRALTVNCRQQSVFREKFAFILAVDIAMPHLTGWGRFRGALGEP